MLERALIVPVLTAHPTEVRRKVDDRSSQPHRRADARARCRRGRRRPTAISSRRRSAPPDRLALADAAAQARAAVRRRRGRDGARLPCATSSCRPSRRSTRAGNGRSGGGRRASFGSAAGSAATATAIPSSTRSRFGWRSAAPARRCSSHYLDAVHALGADLSISTELARVTPDVEALAERSGDASPTRGDEPYRRALTGIYARLAATYRAPHRPRSGARVRASTGEPYSDPEAFRADLRAIAVSLGQSGGGPARQWRRARPADPRGRDVRLPPRDARPAPEFGRARARRGRAARGRRVSRRIMRRSTRIGRVALLRRELDSPRLLATPYARL